MVLESERLKTHLDHLRYCLFVLWGVESEIHSPPQLPFGDFSCLLGGSSLWLCAPPIEPAQQWLGGGEQHL